MIKFKKNRINCQHKILHGRRVIFSSHSPEADLLAGRYAKHGIIFHEDGYLEPMAEDGSPPWFVQMRKIMDFQGYDPAETRAELNRIKRDLEAAE